MLKNSLNYVYDMYLTLNTFNTLRMNKAVKTLTSFHFKNFISYIINNFYTISKVKNYKIVLDSSLDEELYAVYDYNRVIFFNVIMFILNNTTNLTDEKTLTIHVAHDYFSDNSGSYYKLSFHFNDANPLISYEIINEMLESLKTMELKNIDTEKFNMFDLGLILSYYIVTTEYFSDFIIKPSSKDSNSTIIEFNIFAIRKENNSSGPRAPKSTPGILKGIKTFSKLFKKPIYNFEQTYYDRVFDKVYKPTKPVNTEANLKHSTSVKIGKNNTSKDVTAKIPRHSDVNQKYDLGEEDLSKHL